MSVIPDRRTQLYEQFLEQPENTIALEFVRDEEPERGFSEETYEQLYDSFLAFLAARSHRWFDANPTKGMTRMRVTVTIEHE
jgi:hypothetical protein